MAGQNKVVSLGAGIDMETQHQQQLFFMGQCLDKAMERGILRHFWVVDGAKTSAAYVTGRQAADGTLVEFRVKWHGDSWLVDYHTPDKGWAPAKLPEIDLSFFALVGIAQAIELDLR